MYFVPKARLFAPLLCFAFLFFGLLFPIQPSYAAPSDGWDENIQLTGSFTGTFQLNSNTSQLFRVENAMPGDSWSGNITIQNQADEPMEVALLTIASEIEDHSLYNALTLDLEIGGELIYSGAYGSTPSQITPYYVIPAGSSVVLNATVGFPYHYGNQLRNKTMDSVWTFDALYHAENTVPAMYEYTVYYLDSETKESLLPKKVAYAVLDSTVTEYAPNIVGYTPQAKKKTISIQDGGNKIFFFYEAQSQTSELSAGSSSTTSEPSAKVPSGAKTGYDVSQSNSTSIVYWVLGALSVCALLITWLRICAAIQRSRERNTHYE